MQNSFEKDVQQKLDELRLQPSAPVWEKIELEIRPEKRRRRGVFWLLLLAGLLAGGWWIFQPVKNSNLQQATSNVQRAKSNLQQAKNSNEQGASSNNVQGAPAPSARDEEPLKTLHGQQATTTQDFSQQNKPATNSFGKQQQPSPQPGVITSLSSPSSHVFKAQKKDRLSKQNQTVSQRLSVVQKQPSGNVPAQDNALESFHKKSDVKKEDSLADMTTTDERLNQAAATDSAKKSTEVLLPLLNPSRDSATKKKVASARRWHRQVLFSAGWSSLVQASNGKSFANANQLASPGVGIGTGVSFSPSPKTSAGSFAVGLGLVKQISKRWELSVGLQYSYVSLAQKVGEKKLADTVVAVAFDRVSSQNFYRNTQQNNYSNRFHFLELPVSLQYKVSGPLPLYVSVAAVYGRLLSTNALSFSQAANLYVENSKAYNRNALSIGSSLQASFSVSKKLTLRTGPFVQYNLLRMEKEPVENKQHFLVAGLRSAVIF